MRFSPPTLPDIYLASERVYLRPPQQDDSRPWRDLREASRDFLTPWEPAWPQDALTQNAWQRRLQRYSDEWRFGLGFSFLIFKRDDHSLLGGINLTHVRRGVSQMATLGYWMGAPYAGQRYMSEAAALLVDYSFKELDLHRLEAACLPHNQASGRLLRRLGFQEEGLARAYYKINGQWEDHLLFAKLNSD